MNQAAEQQTEFEEETVAEAIESATVDSEEDDGFEIEVVDDTPEEDRGKPRRAEGSEPQIPDDEEIENYNENVQKRIKQLKFEYHEERRAKEEAARLQDEALRYAEQIKQENDRLKKTLTDGEAVLVNQAKGRVDAQLEKARAAYKSAYETGDSDALIEAQEAIAKLSVEKDKYDSYKPKPAPQPAPQPQYQQENIQPRKPSQMGVEWAEDNPPAPWNHYFDHVSLNRAVWNIKDGKISPWLILNCSSGKKMMAKLNEEQLGIIYNIMDPEHWAMRFKRQTDDVQLVKDVAKESNL